MKCQHECEAMKLYVCEGECERGEGCGGRSGRRGRGAGQREAQSGAREMAATALK